MLAEKCFACHGPDIQEADLRLDTREGATAELDSGRRAIVPGEVDTSELIRRVMSDDPDSRMPPEGDPLTAPQIELLRNWIAGSAPYRRHWAYAELNPGSPPRVNRESWAANPIDRYVLEKLESNGVAPSPEADRYTLIKRLYYDLVGIPPTPQSVDRFVNDKSADAYERLVDSLLDSQQFGERWARHWLDKARYADSDGYEKDNPRLNAWRYRDWVIAAINDDMPVDRFTIEQLAGDLLPNATDNQRLATAFHRQTLTNTEGGVDKEQFRVDAVFDRTETTGAVWLGLTVGCARCHSHKYDAISHDEYYRLFAFFNNGDETNISLPTSEAAMQEYRREKSVHERKLAAIHEQIEAAKVGWQVPMDHWMADLHRQLDQSKPIELHDIDAISMTASVAGHEFARQDDGSYLVMGENPDGPVDYTILATSDIDQPITGIQVDALTHDALPSRGPGRVAHGNFVLSEFELSVGEQPIKLTGATATFSQGKFPASNAIDGKLDTGWAISPQMGKDHHARFRLESELRLSADAAIKIQIRQHHGSQHTLGRFRVRLLTGVATESLAPEPIQKILVSERENRTEEQQRQLAEHYFRHEFAATKPLYQQLDALEKTPPSEPMIQVRVIAGRAEQRETKVFDRGDFLSPTHGVTPGGLSVLPTIHGRSEDRLDRLDLANWLMDPSNPLPPRVLSNHVWSHLFGEGLVRTVNDFGVRGESPTHPKLLDWLAEEYRRLGWSRKQLIKTIVMSSTYRQSSVHRPELIEVDPQNLLLARQNRFRVPAEIVRDLCLSVSGLLSAKVGGPSVFPPLPADVASLSYANNFKWQTSKGEDRYRRGMYTFFKRTAPHPNLITFDCPDSNTTSVTRRVSNTPLQALTILNNEVYVEAAQALASRILALDCENDRRRVVELLRSCIARLPTDFEVDRFHELLEQSRDWYAENAEDAKQLAARHSDEQTDPSEAAAWISVARIALNLDEFVTRE